MNEDYEYGYIEYDKLGRKIFRYPDGRIELLGYARTHEFQRNTADQQHRAKTAKNTVRSVTEESGATTDSTVSSQAGPNTSATTSVYMDRIAKALEIHSPVNDERPGKDRCCRYCSTAYPCDTVNVLTGQA